MARPINRSNIWRRCASFHIFYVFRPCDAVETAECWQIALARQDARVFGAHPAEPADLSAATFGQEPGALGAYEIAPAGGKAAVVIFASGSEVEIALKASELLEKRNGSPTRVVSVPCFELFEKQSDGLPGRRSGQRADETRIAIEAARRARAGSFHRHSTALHRHDRLRRLGPGRSRSTSISASPPKRRRRPRKPACTASKVRRPAKPRNSGFAGLAQPNRFKSRSRQLDSLPVRRYEAADQSSAFQLPGREK